MIKALASPPDDVSFFVSSTKTSNFALSDAAIGRFTIAWYL